jgi:hypothetical protein
MYSLYFLKTKWRIETVEGGYMEGTLRQICDFSTSFWGFQTKDFDVALDQMVKNDHDSAHFGIMKHFIYTFDRKDEELQEGQSYGLH